MNRLIVADAIGPAPFNPTRQSLALGLFVFWIFLVIVAVIWLRAMPPKHAARLTFRKRIATGLLIIAGLGILQMVARMIGIDVLEWRLWGYVLFAAALLFSAYAWWDYRTNLPQRIASGGRVQRVERVERPSLLRRSKSSASVTEPAAPATPRPVATTGRRSARRAKKKKR